MHWVNMQFVIGISIFIMLCAVAIVPVEAGDTDKQRDKTEAQRRPGLPPDQQSTARTQPQSDQQKLLSGAFSNRNGMRQHEVSEELTEQDPLESHEPGLRGCPKSVNCANLW